MENFDTALEAFIAGVTQIRTLHMTSNGYESFFNPVVAYTTGPKYIRVYDVNMDGEARSVYCFIDRTNGDVLKAASWKIPAKHARGNIFDEHNGLARCNVNGPEYLR